MQNQLEAAQADLANQTVHGTAGGGLVEATLTGTGELVGLRISPEACDPTDTETLADLIVAASPRRQPPGHGAGPGHHAADASNWGCDAGPSGNEGAGLYEGPIQDLIDELGRLPGIGPKGAQRIAFYILSSDKADVERLAQHPARGHREGPLLRGLLQHRRRGALPGLPRPAPRSQRASALSKSPRT